MEDDSDRERWRGTVDTRLDAYREDIIDTKMRMRTYESVNSSQHAEMHEKLNTIQSGVASEISTIGNRITRLEVRLAGYAAAGAVVGGVIVTTAQIVIKQLLE